MARSRYTGEYTISKDDALRAWKKYDQENKEQMEERKRIAEERLAKSKSAVTASRKAPPPQQQSDKGDDADAKPAASKMKPNEKTDDGQTPDATQRSKRVTRSASSKPNSDDNKPTTPTIAMPTRVTRASSPRRSPQRSPQSSPRSSPRSSPQRSP